MDDADPQAQAAVRLPANDVSRLKWLLPAGLVAATWIAFSPVLRNGFVNWDDEANVVHNAQICDLSAGNLRWMLTTRLGGHFQPLSWLTLALDYQAAGLQPWMYHLSNLIWHTVCVVLVYALALKLLQAAFPPDHCAVHTKAAHWCAAFAAAVFALHPLRVESVAWVTERRDVVSGALIFATVLAYIRAVREPGGSPGWMIGSIALYAVSLTAKAAGMTLPVVLLILDYYPLRRKRSPGRLVLEKVPFLLLAAGAAILAMGAQRSAGAWYASTELPPLARVLVAAHGWWFYLIKLVHPLSLSAFYPLPPLDKLMQPVSWLKAVLVLVALGLAWRRRSARPAVFAALLAYTALMAPVSGLAQSGNQMAADRYSYLPLVPIVILIAGGLLSMHATMPLGAKKSWTPRLFVDLAIIYVIAIALLTPPQCKVWQNSIALWQHAIRVDSHNQLAYVNLGEAARKIASGIADTGDKAALLEMSHSALSTAVKLDDRDANAWNNLGATLLLRQKPAEALPALQRAVELNGGDAGYRCNLGSVLAGFRRLEEAAAQYREAVRLDPQNAHAVERLGSLLTHLGRYAEAKLAFSDAEARGAVTPPLRGTFAWLLATCPQDDIRDGPRAVALAESLCEETHQDDPFALDTLAAAYAESGAFDKAVSTAERALQLAQERKVEPLVAALTGQLALYRAGKPFRDDRPATPPSPTP